MSIRVRCPRCWQTAQIPEEHLGKSGMCNRCGSPVRIPARISKVCFVCGADVTRARHYKDEYGNYLCPDCWAPRKASEQAAFTMPTIECAECHTMVPEGEAVEVEGRSICVSCARREAAARGTAGGAADSEGNGGMGFESLLGLDVPPPRGGGPGATAASAASATATLPETGRRAEGRSPDDSYVGLPALENVRAKVEAELAAEEADDRRLDREAERRSRAERGEQELPPQPVPRPAADEAAAHHDHDPGHGHDHAGDFSVPLLAKALARPGGSTGGGNGGIIVAPPRVERARGGTFTLVLALVALGLAGALAYDRFGSRSDWEQENHVKVLTLRASGRALCARGHYAPGLACYEELFALVQGRPLSADLLREVNEARGEHERASRAYAAIQAEEAIAADARRREASHEQELRRRLEQQEKTIAELQKLVAQLQASPPGPPTYTPYVPPSLAGRQGSAPARSPAVSIFDGALTSPLPPQTRPATAAAPTTPTTGPAVTPPPATGQAQQQQPPPVVEPPPRRGRSIFDDF